jgi:hypothetical protein
MSNPTAPRGHRTRVRREASAAPVRLPFDGRIGTLARNEQVTYSVNDGQYDQYDYTVEEKHPCGTEDAQFILSRSAGGYHVPVLDLDFPVELGHASGGLQELTLTLTTTSRQRRAISGALTRAGLALSFLADGPHVARTVTFHMDAPAEVHPSKTPGHHHLYIDQLMTWRQYKRLLRALARAGVLEKAWVRTSIKSGGTFARVYR